MVFERSQERRSRKWGQFSSPIVFRAISRSNLAGTGSPVVFNDPRTRTAAGRPDSKCRSLAPLFAARLTNDSKSIAQFYLGTDALAKSSSATRWDFLEHLDAMGNGSDDEAQAFDGAAALARQADQQGFADDHGK